MKNWPYALWGGDGSDEEVGSDEEASGEEPSGDVVTLTQSELEAQIARAASRAQRRATKSVREELGFSSQEELKSFIESTREREQAEQDETERARAALEEERTTTSQERAQLRNERVSVAIERAVILAGVTDEAKSNRIATLVRSDLDSDLDFEDLAHEIEEAMSAVKADMPELFAGKQKRNFGSPDADPDSEPDSEEKRLAEDQAKWKAEYARRGGIFPT